MNFSNILHRSATVFLVTFAPLGLTVGAEASLHGGTRSPGFINHEEIRAWLADGERGLWIEASNHQWFYARFTAVCRGLNATNSIVFDTDTSGRVDRNSTVVVPERGRCPVRTLSTSVGPPTNRNADVEPQPQSQ